ncbi:hypothetical protein KVR01_008924 [Diaporthe batatas]|uniref:uncharacterized protein n=1 Tax=Diaporthe batatas TaxID=748121 RepID=UPI001D046000|nr:uncharacterized protein KVR01_008924 [Diaporthe batatas]KAG8160660.1 hypothetical protein KVR01_008924 [Diaporthe batatas]
MAGTTHKKRSRDDVSRSKAAPPLKKQKKKQQQQVPSRRDDSDDAEEFQAVNLLDSDDDDIHNAQVDDGGDSGSDADSVGSMSSSEDERPKAAARTKPARPQPIARDVPANKLARDAPGGKSKSKSGWDEDQGDQSGEEGEGENDEYSDLDDEVSSDDDDDDDDEAGSGDGGAHGEDPARLKQRTSSSKSKRNDPEAFATSISKILGTKISGKNRADPVLARSADARERVRQVQDEELERKARRRLREQKQRAMEKGRVRDVLVATNATFSNVNPVTGEVVAVGEAGGETTADILATERRLRKTAQKGVVQLFNAFRTAQVKAAEAERAARKQGVIGMDNKKDKVTEMSKKGFLDLIASGGGGLKKGPMEEA